MSKILLATIVIISSLASPLALAWDDSRNTSNNVDRYSTDRNNDPKGYNSYNRSRNEDDSNRHSNTSRESDRGSYGSYKSDTRHNTQINDNGLIINRE